MKRRDFLKTPGFFVAAASLSGAAGCGRPAPDRPPGTFEFPQGVASGDPRDSSVVLWTRVGRADGGDVGSLDVIVQVSETNDFAVLVLDDSFRVDGATDHTLRVVVTGLAPKRRYYYRFLADNDTSGTGRTLTAPARDDDSPVRLAWVGCQDFGAGMFGAYRELIKDDLARPEGEQIQVIVHLGDFIYETVGGQFQVPLDDEFRPVELRDLSGNLRQPAPLPSGGGVPGSADDPERFAQNLDDYRHLYKEFLADPDLREARARWPFITIWDDHEFTDDCWQTQANYITGGNLDEPSQSRKVAANRAWFEYIPVQLSGAEGVAGVTQDAADFTPAAVEDVAYEEVDDANQVTEANNLAALATLTIYRSIRYGKNIELVLTDGRSYRSDHAVPENVTQGNQLFFHPRAAMPLDLVNAFDPGREANGGDPPAQVLAIANPRADSPPGTMLGPVQKQWWKDTMAGSDATWKVWGNQVPLMRVLANDVEGILLNRVMTADAWDGYPTERNELMQFLRDQSVGNVVVISGDIHAHFAGLVMDDHDAPVGEQQPVAAEFCAAGVASNSLFSFFEFASRPLPPPVRELVTFDATAMGGDKFAENLNVFFLHGMASARAAAATNDIDAILAAKNPNVNPHLVYADTNSQGYGLLTVTSDDVSASLVTVNRPIVDSGLDGPQVKRAATFTVAKDDAASLSAPTITGTAPFPFESDG